MATKNNAPTGAIIPLPSTSEIKNLPKFIETQEKLNSLNGELTTIDTESRKLVIKNPEDRIRGDQYNKRRKEIEKEADELVAPYKKPLRTWLDFIQQHLNVVLNHGQQVKGILEPKLTAWDNAERRRADDEAARLKKLEADRLAREAEDKRKLDLEAAAVRKKAAVAAIEADFNAGKIGKREKARLLREAGDNEAAAKVQAEADAEERKNTPVDIAVDPIKLPGVRKGRTYYYAKCTDPKAFVLEALKRYCAGDTAMADFLTADAEALNDRAEEMKDTQKMGALFPFLHASEKTSH